MSVFLRRGFGILAIGVYLLQATASAGVGPPHRLLFLFDPQVEAQAARAQQLAVLIEPHSEFLEIVGIVRSGQPAEISQRPVLSTATSPVFETLHAGQALASARISDEAREWLSEVLSQRGDFFAFDHSAGIDLTGRGIKAKEGITSFLRLAGTGAPTDIDFSTWGKVKELFR